MAWLWGEAVQPNGPQTQAAGVSSSEDAEPLVEKTKSAQDEKIAAIDRLLALRNDSGRQESLPMNEPPSRDEDETQFPATRLLSARQLYPDTANCRQLFDQAFYCQSPGGQFVNVYRYGSMRDCALHWQDVWWCMRTNRGSWMSAEERAWEVRRHAWEKEKLVRRRPQGSADDVWMQRKRELSHGIFVDPDARPESQQSQRAIWA